MPITYSESGLPDDDSTVSSTGAPPDPECLTNFRVAEVVLDGTRFIPAESITHLRAITKALVERLDVIEDGDGYCPTCGAGVADGKPHRADCAKAAAGAALDSRR